MGFSLIDVDYVSGGSVSLRQIGVIAQTESAWYWLSDQLSVIASASPVASVPDWWEGRSGLKPVLTIIWRGTAAGSLPNYSTSLPHPTLITPQQAQAQLTGLTYTKGSWQYLGTLSDNSKLIVNGNSQAEAESIALALAAYINPQYLPLNFKVGQRGGKTVKTQTVKAWAAEYYPQAGDGQPPLWRCSLVPPGG